MAEAVAFAGEHSPAPQFGCRVLLRYVYATPIGWAGNDQAGAPTAHGGDAARLDEVLKPGSVDYIFTDPPYGGFISYLDLSILWNHWLGFPISDDSRGRETIVGGECKHTEEHYNYKKSLARSIETSLKLL